MITRFDKLQTELPHPRNPSPNSAAAVQELLGRGVRTVVVKKGAEGAACYEADGQWEVPAFAVEEVDPTGAGDSFAGGFMGQLARSGDHSQKGIRRAILYGSVVASFTVEDFGVKRLTNVSLQDIEERYKSFTQLTDFDT